MILSSNVTERRKALDELFTHVKKDMKATMIAMDGLPVTFRLLDPPLHEFVPQGNEKQAELAKLEKAATALVAAEQEPPEWLKQVVVAIADSFGITAKEFNSRVRVIHPTPIDPVILVDGTPVLSWL